VIGLFTAFQASGQSFSGEAGSRFASNFGQGFGRAGRGRGFAQGLALRAAGFGNLTYQQALERIEGRDPAAMQSFVEMIRGMTSDPDTGAFLVRSAMEGLGVDMSAVQSRELFENGMSMSGGLNRDEAQAALASRRDAAGGAFGAGRFQGGLALQRQAVGASQGRNAQRIQQLDMRVMSVGMQQLGPVMNRLIGSMERLTTAFTEGGFGGLLRQAAAEVTAGAAETLASPIRELIRATQGEEAARMYDEHLRGGVEAVLDPNRSFVGDVVESVGDSVRNRSTARENAREHTNARITREMRDAIRGPAAERGVVAQFPGQSASAARIAANNARLARGLAALPDDAPVMAAEHLEEAAALLRNMQAAPGDVTVE
jgi:hypothetical protein